MHPALLKLVALLLLLSQGAVALAPGRAAGVICIPVHECTSHDHAAPAACGHRDAAGLAAADGRDTTPDHFRHCALLPAPSPDRACCCHVHVPVPNNGQATVSPRGGKVEPRAWSVPSACALAEPPGRATPRTAAAPVRPPAVAACDRLRALRATHLLI
jgi:hypothetical protein